MLINRVQEFEKYFKMNNMEEDDPRRVIFSVTIVTWFMFVFKFNNNEIRKNNCQNKNAWAGANVYISEVA